MNPKPTGRLRGNDLVIKRSFAAPIEDVWTSITHPESTARWFGRWEGTPGVGNNIRVQMEFEQGKPWCEATIERCEAPRYLGFTVKDNHGDWRIELALTSIGDSTELEFVHHLVDRAGVGEVGPGWEYYLDMLVAARQMRALPTFDAYYPAQKSYYMALTTES